MMLNGRSISELEGGKKVENNKLYNTYFVGAD